MILALKLIVAISLFAIVFQQVRKPSSFLGRRVLRGMNLAHASMTDWGLNQLAIPNAGTLLDVGCGGGRTIQRLAALAPQGKVFGVDYSATSVAASRITNEKEIAAGRVRVEQASVAALPFPDKTFDVVTAVETHYYWPDLPASVREVLRVVKPGGTFSLIAETHRNGWRGQLYRIPMALLHAAHLSDAEFRALLSEAGFAGVRTVHRPGKNWICAVGQRPTGSQRSAAQAARPPGR